jgi:cytochrome c
MRKRNLGLVVRGSAAVAACLSVVLVAIPAAVPAIVADAGRGRDLFAACFACHSEAPDALGPSLKGVVGRKAGSLEDFRYSNAMARADVVWDDANLRDYLLDPQAKVKGNHMPFSGFTDARDADDVVAYLHGYR